MTKKLTLKEFAKLTLSFGLKGDYYLLRHLTQKCPLFLPLYKLYEAFHCAFLPLCNTMHGYILFPHNPYGCFFSQGAVIGTGCTIMQQVTIGSNNVTKGDGGGAPVIGNNVFIGAGAKIIGDITIGDNVRIGAGCVVAKSIPANTTVVLQSPRLIIRD